MRLPSNKLDLLALGRTPLRLGIHTRRITSTDLQIVEARDELLAKEVPELDDFANDISLIRGFKATIPSSERNKTRRRQTRNVETPRIGLKKLGMNARGLLMDAASSEEDLVVVERSKGKGKRRARESLGASVALGEVELQRQTGEILLDKENIHVRRVSLLNLTTRSSLNYYDQALIRNQISEITHKIDSLVTTRSQLEQDLLKLKEEELELDDERT